MNEKSGDFTRPTLPMNLISGSESLVKLDVSHHSPMSNKRSQRSPANRRQACVFKQSFYNGLSEKIFRKMLHAIRTGAITGSFKYIKKQQINIVGDLVHYPETVINILSQANKGERLIRNIALYYSKSIKFLLDKIPCGKKSYQKLSKVAGSVMPKLSVMKPTKKRIIFWELIGTLLSFLCIFIASLGFCLQISVSKILVFLGAGDSKAFHALTVLVFLFYAANIVIQFNMAYYVTGELILSKGLIRKHYLKTGFFWDFASLIPFFIGVCVPNYCEQAVGFEGLLILIKIKDIFSFVKKIENLVNYNEVREAVCSLIVLFGSILIINHFIACIWCLLVRYPTENSLKWTQKLDISDVLNPDVQMQIYLKASYWSLTTIVTLGYGDLVPQNNLEIGFCMLVMLLGSAIFGFSVNKIGIILENIKHRDRILRKHLTIINQYMQRKSIPYELQGRVRKYLEYSFKEETRPDIQAEQILLQRLSTSLLAEVKSNIHGDLLHKIPCLSKNFKPETLARLTQHIKTTYFRPGETIIEKDQINNQNLYIVCEGEARMDLGTKRRSSKNTEDEFAICYSRGKSFGEYSFFSAQPHIDTIRSFGYSTFWFLKREDFFAVLKETKSEYEKYCEIRDRLLSYDFKCLGLLCQCCEAAGHPISYCPSIRFNPPRINIVGRYNYSCPQKRDRRFKRKRIRDRLGPLSNNKENAYGCKQYQTLHSDSLVPSLSIIMEDATIMDSSNYYDYKDDEEDNDNDNYNDNGPVESNDNQIDTASQVPMDSNRVSVVPLSDVNCMENMTSLFKNKGKSHFSTFARRTSITSPAVAEGPGSKEKRDSLSSPRNTSQKELTSSRELPSPHLVKTESKTAVKRSRTILPPSDHKHQKEHDCQTTHKNDDEQSNGILTELTDNSKSGDLFNYEMDHFFNASNYFSDQNMDTAVLRARKSIAKLIRRKRKGPRMRRLLKKIK